MKKKRTPTVRSEASRGTAGDEPADEPRLVRLNRYLALNGIASRRRADELIVEGEVMVDDEIVNEVGMKIDPERQRVEVDGVVLKPDGERKRYYLLNKPSGVVCTNDQREGKPRAADMILDKKKGRIYTVGRLDEDTTGLVILTNDGDFAYRISHPRYGIRKVYRVTVVGELTDVALAKLRAGVRLSDFKSNFERVTVAKRSRTKSTVLVTLGEGRNREIRRVFGKLGFPVRDLRRVEVGCLKERGLKVGHWRPLTRDEVNELLDLAREENAGPVPPKVKRYVPRSRVWNSGGSRANAAKVRRGAGAGAGAGTGTGRSSNASRSGRSGGSSGPARSKGSGNSGRSAGGQGGARRRG